VQDIAISDGIPDLFDKSFSSHALESFNHELLSLIIFAISSRLTPLFPLAESILGALASLGYACLSKTHEHTLFKAEFSYKLTQTFKPFLKLFGFDPTEPYHESIALFSALIPPKHCIKSLPLILSQFNKISPPA
jgi:hypothetical protein